MTTARGFLPFIGSFLSRRWFSVHGLSFAWSLTATRFDIDNVAAETFSMTYGLEGVRVMRLNRLAF